MTQSEQFLMAAFAGESLANRRNLAYAPGWFRLVCGRGLRWASSGAAD